MTTTNGVEEAVHKARLAMENDQDQARLFYGVVEADEPSIGGKPRRTNRHRAGNQNNARGRGTKQPPL